MTVDQSQNEAGNANEPKMQGSGKERSIQSSVQNPASRKPGPWAF
jgi:hypothetical protein